MPEWNPLLDPPAFPPHGYAGIADRLARLLQTKNDVLLVQGEAIIALEATATSLSRPGRRAVNVVTSPYGRWFGEWLRRGGAEVVDVVAEAGKPISPEAVESAIAAARTDIVALVHAESATGILNPLTEIAALARAGNAVLVVDAVASFGGHPLDVDALSAGIVVVGPQKSVGGSAGTSALSVSPAAWALIEAPAAPAPSTLSLLELKRGWIDTGRGVLPGMPSALEFFSLAAALDRIEAEGLDTVIARHTRAGEATRAAIEALGLPLWVPAAGASNLVTAGPMPPGVSAADLVGHVDAFDAAIAPGVGEAGQRLVRLNHTGPRANFSTVLANVAAYAHGLAAVGHAGDTGAALEAVIARYAG